MQVVDDPTSPPPAATKKTDVVAPRVLEESSVGGEIPVGVPLSGEECEDALPERQTPEDTAAGTPAGEEQLMRENSPSAVVEEASSAPQQPPREPVSNLPVQDSEGIPGKDDGSRRGTRPRKPSVRVYGPEWVAR
jgi:hypothetical protein